jgi:glycosyltransferase involved in cell wall biosynthesis
MSLRIAHVSDFYAPRCGGVEVHVSDLAVRQAAQGHTVDVLTATPGPLEPPRDGVGTVRLAAGGWMPGFRPAVRAALREAIAAGRYDVVHAHAGPVTPLAFSAAALGAERPTVVTVHSMAGPAEKWFRALDRATGWSSWPVLWTAVSAAAAAPLARLVGPRVEVLPNGIDVAAWRVPPVTRDPDDVVAVAVMRLASRKRPLPLVRLLQWAHGLCDSGIRLRTVVIGDGPQRGRVERYVERHGLSGQIELAGRRSRAEVRQALARADVFVAPAVLESFGIAALEARCAGVPVISRREGGTREFIRHGREGLLVSDDASMARALAALANDPDRRHRIAAHNRAVPPVQDWSNVLGRTEELYHRAGASARSRKLVA